MKVSFKLNNSLKLSLIIFSPIFIYACQNVNQTGSLHTSNPTSNSSSLNPSSTNNSSIPIPTITPSYPMVMCSPAPPVFENYTALDNGTNFKKLFAADPSINSLSFVDNGKNIIYYKYDKRVLVKFYPETQDKKDIIQDLDIFSISPDKKQIAYTKYLSDNSYNLFISDTDGLNQRKINQTPVSYPRFINWSNDNKKIAIDQGKPSDDNKELLIFDLSGKSYQTSFVAALYTQLVWSPDNKKLGFISAEDKSAQIYYFDLDTNKKVKVTNDPQGKSNLSWSYDSEKLFYYPYIEGKNTIYSVNIDGSKQSIVADNLSSNKFYFSNDSKFIAYQGLENNKSSLYLVDTTTLLPKVLTDLNNSEITDIKWFPDYKNIAFTTYGQYSGEKYNNKYNNDIYIINSDGTSKLRLTNSPASEDLSDLSPDNKTILFNSNISVYGADGCNAEQIENWNYLTK